jgi:RND family efflux transporter MFP subunit
MKRAFGTSVGLMALLATACGEPEHESISLSPADVELATSAQGPSIGSYAATVVSERSAVVSTRSAGSVREVPVNVGSVVRAGAVLVRLDGADVEARVASAEAAATLAQQYYDRIASLERDGAATRHELDEATRGVQQAEAARAEAEAQRRYVVLRAPFSGVVVSRTVDPGDLAVPATPLVRLSSLQGLEIEADLPAQLRGEIEPGDTVEVRSPEGDFRSIAVVSRVAPALEAGSQRFRVEARLPEGAPESLPLPGTVVRLEIPLPGESTVWIPSDAVVRRGQLRGVFTIEADSLRLRWVRLGQERTDAVEVLAGLSVDERVVRGPGAELIDGQPSGNIATSDWSPSGGRK